MTNFKRVNCKNCRRPIYRSIGRFHENLKFKWNFYCSSKCLSQDKTRKQKLTCENCGKAIKRIPSEISPHNYCSQSCAAVVSNRMSPRRIAELRTCIECGKNFKKSKGNSKYCSMQCRIKSKNYTSEQLIGIITQFAQKLKRTPARREMEKFVKPCVKIFGSWNNAVQAARLIPNRSHNSRMYKRVNARAMDGHLCDSISELLIDNWLYKNKISHKRDAHYPDTHHKADWKIFTKDKYVFVEYFGLANDSPRYDRSIKEKKTLCKKHKISLIEIYPKDIYPKIHLENNLKNKFEHFLR